MKLLSVILLSSFTSVLACTSPLFLTPLIESNQIEKALQCSKVADLMKDGPSIASYAGFLTVNKTYNSNLFFYFFPSMVILNHWELFFNLAFI